MTHPDLPPRLRDLIPPLFYPHRPDFTNAYRDRAVPPITAEAEEWLQQAVLLEWNQRSPSDEKDWHRIIGLTRKAAALGHWKARLNLIHLRLEGRGLQCGLPLDFEAALQELEHAMALGIPDAYSMMGDFYRDGIGVPRNRSAAFAFYQRAAEMGSPAAQTVLAQQLDALHDHPDAAWWGNQKVARKMLRCALAQGYAPAAALLGRALLVEDTPESKAIALQVLHAGVKMGSAECASALGVDFRTGAAPGSAAPLQDQARSARYLSVAALLEYYEPVLKLPNLDKALPLPPAGLPPWDGHQHSLLKAAKALRKGPPPPAPTPASQRSGRAYLAAEFEFAAHDATAVGQAAPRAGYWLPVAHRPFDLNPAALAMIEACVPVYYAAGEPFDPLYDPTAPVRQSCVGVAWHAVPTRQIWPPALPARVRYGLEDQLGDLPDTPTCRGDEACPQTGYWQASIKTTHPHASWLNGQITRQAWVIAQAAFPHPQHEWLLPDDTGLRKVHIHWQLLEADEPTAWIGTAPA